MSQVSRLADAVFSLNTTSPTSLAHCEREITQREPTSPCAPLWFLSRRQLSTPTLSVPVVVVARMPSPEFSEMIESLTFNWLPPAVRLTLMPWLLVPLPLKPKISQFST